MGAFPKLQLFNTDCVVVALRHVGSILGRAEKYQFHQIQFQFQIDGIDILIMFSGEGHMFISDINS